MVEHQQVKKAITQQIPDTGTSLPVGGELEQLVADVYREVVAVPYLANVTVFGRRHSSVDGRLQLFCMTDERSVGKTLERRDGYVKVASFHNMEVCH